MMQWMAVLVCLLAADQARSSEPSWDTLRVTWGMDVSKENVFAKMPLTSDEAKEGGFVPIDASSPCAGKFLGFRYYKSGDPGLVLLYDVNGYIAGIQANYLTRLMTKDAVICWFKQSKVFVQDTVGTEAVYSITAYFVDPAKICTTGRTQAEYDASPTGTQLSIQNGSNPLTNLIEIPLSQDDLANTGWTKGKCFPSMGMHYWYEANIDMNCDNFKPVFLLYNDRKLTGLGYAGFGNFQNSDRFEHPPKAAFSRFMDPVPDCLPTFFDEVDGVTSMHVYMNAEPWNLICI